MKSLKFWKNKHFNDFREFFWPLLEPLEKGSIRPKFSLNISDECIDTTLEYAKKIYDAEEDRRKGIESKAALFLSTISIATTLIVASNTMIFSKPDTSIASNISIFISVLLSIYTVRTVWFSVKALERGKYHVLGFKDIDIKGNITDYKKKLIVSFATLTRANYDVIDDKVDSLAMAQAYYKRAIVIISIYAFWILFFSFFVNKGKVDRDNISDKNQKTITNIYNLDNTFKDSLKIDSIQDQTITKPVIKSTKSSDLNKKK